MEARRLPGAARRMRATSRLPLLLLARLLLALLLLAPAARGGGGGVLEQKTVQLNSQRHLAEFIGEGLCDGRSPGDACLCALSCAECVAFGCAWMVRSPAQPAFPPASQSGD